MKIYNHDRETGEFTFESEARPSPLEPGVFLIPAYATTTEPPVVEDQQAAVFINGGWTTFGDYRKADVWEKATGHKVKVSGLGPLPNGLTLVSPGELEFPTWTNDAWVEDETAKRAAAEFKIRQKYDAELAALGRPYLENEQKGWAVQEAEARAYIADDTAAVPYISTMAITRGIPVATMAAKILENAELFRSESARILGEQQREIDLLNS